MWPGRLDIDQPLNLKIGLGFEAEDSAFIRAEVHPVVVVHFSEQYATSVEIRDDRITLEGTAGTVEADIVDGTITEVRYNDGDEAYLTVRVGRQAVEKLARELAELDVSFLNDYDSDNPLPSSLSFLLQEYSYQIAQSGDEESAQQVEALTQWVDEALARWWRDRFADRTGSDTETSSRIAKFTIQHVPVTLENWTWLPHLGPPLADALFERGSAPWTLLRELNFHGAEMRDPRSMAEMARLIDAEETGPLACLFAAALLGSESPESAASVARLGLSRMDEAHLRHDLHALFVESDGMRSAVELAGSLARSIPNDARPAILAQMRGWAGFLGAWSHELDRASDADPADVLVEILVDKWHNRLGSAVNGLLQRYVQANENATTRK